LWKLLYDFALIDLNLGAKLFCMQNASPRGSQLKSALKELPQTFSDFLGIIIALSRELLTTGSKKKVAALLQQYPGNTYNKFMYIKSEIT